MKKLILAVSLICALAGHAIKTDQLKWHDMKTMPLHGTLAPDASASYSRLPDSLQSKVRSDLWALGLNSAGLYVRFRSDASAIGAKWHSRNKFNMNHMTAAGVRGLDLYTRLDDGTWTTMSSARPAFNNHSTTTMVITDMKPEMREYMLYLSLYDGVDSLYIGVDSAAVVEKPVIDSPRAGKPIIMYGTSILQGGCATRPGMVHTSILSRMLDTEVINLGFSGNGKLDLEIADMIASSPASIIVVDALPNNTTEALNANLEPFLARIRRGHPTTPVVLVESPIFPLMRFNQETLATITTKNQALHDIYERLSATDPNLHYYTAENILGDCWEGTVDNYHFTDLGFDTFARNMAPMLQSLLTKK